jgi:hypothetical protein
MMGQMRGLILAAICTISPSILHSEVLMLDCGDATHNGKIAYLINPPDVRLIGQEEPNGVTAQRTITPEGIIVNSYTWSGIDEVASIISVSPSLDDPSVYRVQRAVTSTGEFTEFTCTRDTVLELLLSESLTEIIGKLSDFQKPLDVLLYSAMDLQGIKIHDNDSSLTTLLTTPIPLTDVDIDPVTRQIGSCWVVDNGAEWAAVSVTVEINLDRDGKIRGDVELIDYSGENSLNARIAFEAARRAILRCQSSGYNLPEEKYEDWKSLTITFDPSSMRILR